MVYEKYLESRFDKTKSQRTTAGKGKRPHFIHFSFQQILAPIMCQELIYLLGNAVLEPSQETAPLFLEFMYSNGGGERRGGQ